MRWLADFDLLSPHPAVPLLVCTPADWSTWRGRDMDTAAFESLEGVVGVCVIDGVSRVALPAFEQGTFSLGVDDGELTLLHWFGRGKGAARRKRIAARADAEYLAGVIEVPGALAIGHAWTSGWPVSVPAEPARAERDGEALFVVPLAPGRYVVLEGRDEDEEEATWLRLRRDDPAKYAAVRPPPEPTRESPADEAKRLVGEIEHVRVDGKQLVGANALDAVKRIVALGEASVLDARAASLDATRPAYARWLRVLTAAATGEDATTALTSLAEEWLAPATSTRSANQDLSAAQLLQAFTATASPSAKLSALRARVEAAPPPEVFVPEGDFF